MSDPVYFVTGASGFIGRALCKRLRAEGYPVRALTRSARDEGLEALGVQLVQGDLLDPGSYRAALAGSGVVVHLGADASFGNGAHYERVNHAATRALLEEVSAQCPGLSRFVSASSLAAVDRPGFDACALDLTESSPMSPTTDYGRSKRDSEQAVRSSKLPWVIVRPTLVVGAEMRESSHVSVFARMALRGSLVSRFDFAGKMGIIHVDDLVAALLLVSRRPAAARQIYFASSYNVALGELFGWIKPRSRLSPALFPKVLARFFPFKLKALFLNALSVDSSKLRALGWAPAIPARQAVAEVARVQAARLDPFSEVPGWTVVTGAASGLGRALAAQLARSSRKLILVDRNERALAEVLAPGAPGPSAGTQVRRITADLGNPGELERLLDAPFWRDERVDEVFLCAGFGVRGKVAELDGRLQASQLDVNVSARIRITRRALPGMLARKFGRIVLVSSSSAFQPLPYMGVYAASNSAVLAFGEALSAELAGSGVQVQILCPGGMKTAFQKSAGVKVVPGEKLDEPADVAQQLLLSLGRGKTTVLVGLRCKAMSLLARVLPRSWNLALWKRLMQGLR